MDQQEHPDWTLITDLGGPAKVAERIGATVQRVQNWKTRGIPAAVKLRHRFLLRKARATEQAEG